MVVAVGREIEAMGVLPVLLQNLLVLWDSWAFAFEPITCVGLSIAIQPLCQAWYQAGISVLK